MFFADIDWPSSRGYWRIDYVSVARIIAQRPGVKSLYGEDRDILYSVLVTAANEELKNTRYGQENVGGEIHSWLCATALVMGLIDEDAYLDVPIYISDTLYRATSKKYCLQQMSYTISSRTRCRMLLREL